MSVHGDHEGGAAWRRRQRRLRMHWRHEQLTLQMALAAALHHSRDVGPVSYPALRSQKTARAGGGGVEREVNYEPRVQNPPLPQAASTVFYTFGDDEVVLAAGVRPAPLSEVWPQGKPARGSGSWCFDVPDVTMQLAMEDEEEEVAVPLMVSQEPVIVQEFPEVLAASSLVRAVQPADVKQVLDVPVLHMFDIDNNLYEFLDLASFQEIPEVQDVELHIPPGPVHENFVEQVVDVPLRVSLGPVTERIVEQVVDAPVRGQVPLGPVSEDTVEQVMDVPGRVSLSTVSERILVQVVDAPVRGQVPNGPVSDFVEQVVDVPVARDFLPGHAQQLDTCIPAAWLGAPQEQFVGFFRTFPQPKKKCEDCWAVECESARALELIHAGCSA